MHEWISTADQLPPLYKRVWIVGDYTPLDENGQPLYGLPTAQRLPTVPGLEDGDWIWISGEWRGQSGVRWWRAMSE